MKPSDDHSELDSMVVQIELTLISITQGVALFFLIDNARSVFSLRQIVSWPYIAAGLLIILIFWSRAILHTLTLIRWPLEFGHNFVYIACALGESLLFTRLNNPRAWFVLGALYAVIVWFLFVYDLRLIRARERDSAGDASDRLYKIVTRDQWLNIGALLPGLFVLNLLGTICVRAWPEFFLARNGHVWLAIVQVATFAIYLLYAIRFYVRLAPLIAQARDEWRRPTAKTD